MDTLTERLLAGGLDRGQAVAQNGGEDVDELAVAIGGTDELAADPLQPGGQHPALEGRAVAQGSRLTGKDGDVVPRIADRPVAPEPGRSSAAVPRPWTGTGGATTRCRIEGRPRQVGTEASTRSPLLTRIASLDPLEGLAQCIRKCASWPLKNGIRQFALGGRRAPHKPLLLLYGLARLKHDR